MTKLSSILAGAIILIVGAGPLNAADPGPWPQWRGPSRDGIVAGPSWPSNLKDDSMTKVWRVGLGPSFSGPIVAADRIFVTESIDDKYEAVRALDRKTGKEIWKTQWEGAMKVAMIARARGNWIKATPAYDGESLYVAGMRDVLVCLDAKTGAERWRVDFTERYKTPLPEFGNVSSPLVLGDHVYVQSAFSFIKLDKKTGATVWRTLVQDQKKAPEGSVQANQGHNGPMSTPIFANINGKPQFLVQMMQEMNGVDPETGNVLWSGIEDKTVSPGIMTPAVYGNKIFTSSGGIRSGLYEVKNSGVERLWDNKTVVYMSSAVVVGDYVYMHLKNGRLACLDLKTGKEAWITTENYGQYCSFVAQGDRILALSEKGDLILFRATPEKFEQLDTRTVADATAWSYLAVADGEVYVRDLNGLSVFRWQGTASEKLPVP